MSGKGSVCVQSIVTTGPDVIASRLEDEVVILDLKSGIYHGLEAVGARIWELMSPTTPVHVIRDSLLDEYEVEPERCEQDVLALLDELNSHGLLEVRHEAAD